MLLGDVRCGDDLDAGGRVDLLVNNAGIYRATATPDLPTTT